MQDTKAEVPNSLVDSINVFAVGIDPDESLKEPLLPIVSKPTNIIEPDDKLFTFSQKLLESLPEVLSGNVLVNDLYWANEGLVTNISFMVTNAQDFITTHQLSGLGAMATNSNHVVNIPLPIDGSVITIVTPTEGKLMMDNGGNYQYVPSYVETQYDEIFTYTLLDAVTQISKTANLTIHLYGEADAVERVLGNHNDNVLSSEGLNGVIYMEAGRGEDHFVIDFANQSVPTVYINDLLVAQQNQLHFQNVFDTNQDNQINLQDVFMSFEQAQENANVKILLNNADFTTQFSGTELIFENIGTVPGREISDLINHLESITNILDVI